MYEKTVKYVTFKNLIKHLLTFKRYSGFTNRNGKKYAVLYSVPKKFSPNQLFNNPTTFYRLRHCLILCQLEVFSNLWQM